MTEQQIKILDAILLGKDIEWNDPPYSRVTKNWVAFDSVQIERNSIFSLINFINRDMLRIKPEPVVEWVDIDEGTELKAGDKVHRENHQSRFYRIILGICDSVIFISAPDLFDELGGSLTKTQMRQQGYKLKVIK